MENKGEWYDNGVARRPIEAHTAIVDRTALLFFFFFFFFFLLNPPDGPKEAGVVTGVQMVNEIWGNNKGWKRGGG